MTSTESGATHAYLPGNLSVWTGHMEVLVSQRNEQSTELYY